MNKLQSIGLIDTTTKTQKSNGTQCFYDPIMDCDYLTYASGYVRRAYTRASYYSSNIHRIIYQLNLKRPTTSIIDGKEYDHVERILIPTEESRIDRLSHCAIVYRKNNYK